MKALRGKPKPPPPVWALRITGRNPEGRTVTLGRYEPGKLDEARADAQRFRALGYRNVKIEGLP